MVSSDLNQCVKNYLGDRIKGACNGEYQFARLGVIDWVRAETSVAVRLACAGQSVRSSRQVHRQTVSRQHMWHTVHTLNTLMDPDRQRLVSKVWEGVWAGEGSASPRSDSGLNSLEYWDYSVELECITGQQGDTETNTERQQPCLNSNHNRRILSEL